MKYYVKFKGGWCLTTDDDTDLILNLVERGKLSDLACFDSETDALKTAEKFAKQYNIFIKEGRVEASIYDTKNLGLAFILGGLAIKRGFPKWEYVVESKDPNFEEKVDKILSHLDLTKQDIPKIRENRLGEEDESQQVISESKEIPKTRRFNHQNPGACFMCPNPKCNQVWSADYKPGVDFNLNFCPNCGTSLKGTNIEANIAEKIMSLLPEASILSYGDLVN